MRLLTATVRAYRLHRETTVVFDPHRTLIGGPNETGKSTFAEAIHRALFFKAKGNTEEHRKMKSAVHQGTPEVELSFETAYGVYQLKKRFGASGETTLTPPRGAALTGEAAESALARALSVEAGGSTKNCLSQWAHLWVWQTQSTEDPTPHATSQRDSLIQRLQSLGGAAAMLSDRDSRTAAAAACAWEEIFTSGGKVKAGSALALAEAAMTEAETAETAARTRLELLAQSVRSFTDAENRLAQLGHDTVELGLQLDLAAGQEVRIRQLRAEEAGQAAAAAAVAAKRQALEQQEAQITGIRRQSAELGAELAPLEQATAVLAEQAAAAHGLAAAAGQMFEAAAETVRSARQAHDFAGAWLQQHEATARLEALRQKAVQAAGHEMAAEKIRLELAGLAPVDATALASLQKLDAAHHAAAAALTAMAAGVELLSAGMDVQLDGVSLSPGETRILTEDGELSVGDACRLRIRPGGGTSLAEARDRERQAHRQFHAALETSGVRSIDEAVRAAALRNDLGTRLVGEQAALKSLKASTLPALLAEALTDHATAAAETSRKAEALGQAAVPAPADAEEVRAAIRDAAKLLEETEAAAVRAKAQRDAAVRSAAGHAATVTQHQESLRERQQRLTGLRAQRDLLLTNHGADPDRAAALTESSHQLETAEALLSETLGALAALQPEHSERNLERLKRSLLTLQEQRTLLENQRAVATDQLRSDGSQDPASTLALAEARALAARELVERLRRQAAARGLLHETFKSEQAALSECFTQPLADRISGYLECLFGPGTRAAVVLQDNQFDGLEIQRPGRAGGAFSFDALSGGTREQTAAAVRLAMAEVLAADHGGTLPVIFDDAFAFSDASRLNALQNMLDLAASRGLQVIVLTHEPAGYTTFGARVVQLE